MEMQTSTLAYELSLRWNLTIAMEGLQGQHNAIHPRYRKLQQAVPEAEQDQLSAMPHNIGSLHQEHKQTKARAWRLEL
jgi:hypothetical protein